MTIFDFLKQITYNKSPWSSFSEEDQKEFNPYLIHRFISMNIHFVHVANAAQSFPTNEKEKIYNFYCELLPKTRTYSKYIKNNTVKINEDILKYISKYYECSFGEAEDYLYIIRKEGVEEILNTFGLEDKIIKKLLKEIKI
jgi:hypothetical protein